MKDFVLIFLRETDQIYRPRDVALGAKLGVINRFRLPLGFIVWLRPSGARAETILIAIGTQDTTIDCATGGLIVREKKLLERYLSHEGKYKDATYDSDVRQVAVMDLAEMIEPGAADLLLAGLRDSAAPLRQAAAKSLEEHDGIHVRPRPGGGPGGSRRTVRTSFGNIKKWSFTVVHGPETDVQSWPNAARPASGYAQAEVGPSAEYRL